jgi:riboflavin biosynthesis pyrimidine reductase
MVEFEKAPFRYFPGEMIRREATMQMIDQVFPTRKQVPLEGLYLEQRLMDLATEIGRSVVLTDYLTDKNGLIAKAGKDGQFQIPVELKNASDWGLYQELMAQADVTISGGSYYKRLATDGAQDILHQFEPGNTFEKLGEWRLKTGYPKRSPDLAIVSRHLDFELPQDLLRSSRRIVIFTTDSMEGSDKARALRDANATIVGSGDPGVDGGRMIATLADEMGYRVVMMVSGPHVLDLLLRAGRLDLLYVTQAQVEIPLDDPAAAQTVLLGGRKISELKEFRLARQFLQENVLTEAGSRTAQSFFRYDRKDLPM